MNGASRQDYGDPALARSNSSVSQSSRDSALKNQSAKDSALTERRDALRQEYREKIASGEVREMTEGERLKEQADSNPESEATKAAQRILEKRAAFKASAVSVQGGTVIVGGPRQETVVPVAPLVQQHHIAYKNGSTIGSPFSSRADAEQELSEYFPNRDDMEVRSGEAEEPPKAGTYYRGTNPDETKRISTGDPVWDSHLFAADQVKHAKNYGRSIEQIQLKPTAKVLVEGSSDFKKLVGDYKPGESMLSYSSRAAKLAKAAGYDLVHFKLQGDVGTAIMNRDAIESRKPYTSVRDLMVEAAKRNPTKMIP
jgi:hypothetical protein